MVKLMKEERTKQIRSQTGKRKARESEDGANGRRSRSGERERSFSSFTVAGDFDIRTTGRGVNFHAGGSGRGSARKVPGRGKAIRGGLGGARIL